MTGFTDPHDSAPRVAHVKDPADEAFLAGLNNWLAAMPTQPAADCRAPLIYVVGAPRSGTTLLSQLLSKYFEVGYINNLIARFWLRPSAGIRLSQICLGPGARQSIALRAAYGVTSEIAGPHEFGYFWRHWLRLDQARTHHLADDELARIDRHGLRAALTSEILGTFGLPVVFKNVICGLQARFLSDLHPSLFVYIERDPVDTACSILESRRARYGRLDAWWSLRPAAMHQILAAATPAEQVALQVLHSRREFRQELASPGVRTVTISYRELCHNPERELAKVCEAAAACGAPLDPPTAIEPLTFSRGPLLTDDLRAEVARCYAAHDGDPA